MSKNNILERKKFKKHFFAKEMLQTAGIFFILKLASKVFVLSILIILINKVNYITHENLKLCKIFHARLFIGIIRLVL